MVARPPADKIQKCMESISGFLTRKNVQLSTVSRWSVKLRNVSCDAWDCLSWRLYDLIQGVMKPHHFICLRSEVKDDLRMWLTFLSTFNGVYFFRKEEWSSSAKLNLHTDASGSIGFGAIFGAEWCYGRWPPSWLYRNIAILEFFPIVLSLCLWGSQMRNKSILFFTDNEALVYIINRQSCRDKTLMFFVRKLVLVRLENNIVFKANHIPGTKNNWLITYLVFRSTCSGVWHHLSRSG